MNILMSQCRASTLGAINGLLLGSMAELSRQVYNGQRELERLAANGGSIIDVSDPIKDMPIVVLVSSVVFFTIASLLVHRYLANRLKTPILIWQIVGVVAVIGACLMTLVIALIDAPVTHQTFWDIISPAYKGWLFILGIVAVFNLIYGTIIQISLKHYLNNKKTLFT
jgi:hypothetical protein